MIRKLKRWIDLFQEEATTVPGCKNQDPVRDHASAGDLEPKEESGRDNLTCSNDVIANDAIPATTVPGCNNEQIIKDHSTVGELEPNEEKGQNGLVDENSVTENGVTNEAKDPEAKGESCLDPSLEGKSLNTENESVCQGATSWEKIGPDYPLFPLSRGFCLSLRRALESFQAALDKAGLTNCLEKP